MSYVFQQLAKKATAAGINLATPARIAAAKQWFRDAASQISSVNPNKMLSSADPFTSFQAIGPNSIGKMYFFLYDAKTKDKLPYWDRFPLIFPIELYNNGFLGINFHYISPIFRAKLMDSLYTIANNKNYDNTMVLNISYQTLKSYARHRYFRPCVKRYLNSHVRSKFMYINPARWDQALFLPAERFQKKAKQYVWNESISQFV